jgi:hypothetical protein
VTADGRYFVVHGRLWRMANPGLDQQERSGPIGQLMAARRAVRDAKQTADPRAEAAAHRAVDDGKRALGEPGAVERRRSGLHMAKNTYAAWCADVSRRR